MNSSTDKATIDKEIVGSFPARHLPECRIVALKALSKVNAAGTVDSIASALETECEGSDWKSKVVGLSADGAAVNMGVSSGTAKQMQDKVSHLVPVHCCAHRVELAIKDISTGVHFFKSLEGILVELYKLYHKSPLCWSGLQQVG